MNTIPAGEFKAKCLKLMDIVAQKHHEIVITKHGIPVAKIVPIEKPQQPFGALKNSVEIFSQNLADETMDEE